jgi:crotonobetainyl-CoA:carnitine CoA-transferase CaiB-like acyl-CoA transferase
MYRRWAKLMGEESWLTDPRFATDALRGEHGETITERMQRWCGTKTKNQALTILEANRIAAYPVYSPQDALDDPHIQGFLRPLAYRGLDAPAVAVETPFRMSRTPPTFRTPPPELGAHTAQVLAELGYTAKEIGALEDAAAI